MVNWGELIERIELAQIGVVIEWRKLGRVFVYRTIAEQVSMDDMGIYLDRTIQDIIRSLDYAEANGFTTWLWDFSEFNEELGIGNAGGMIFHEAVERAKRSSLRFGQVTSHQEHAEAGKVFFQDRLESLFKASDAEITAWLERHR